MILFFYNSFTRDYKTLPKDIQKRLDKQLSFLVVDIKHPSLRIKKMRGRENIWEGRVTQGYRFTFELENDYCRLRRAGTHPILRNP